MSKEILYNTNAREKIKAGIDKLADSVKVTFGANGRNVVISSNGVPPYITKDGVTVASSIYLSDEIENVGAQIIKNVAAETARYAGDGTTTATILAQAIFAEGYKTISAGANPVHVKRGIDKAVIKIVEKLAEISQPIGEGKDNLRNIASISANSDIAIGELVAEVFFNIGVDGVVHLEESKTSETKINIVEGVKVPGGLISNYFITNEQKATAELDNPLVLICDEKISSIDDLVPAIQYAVKEGRAIVIFAEDFQGEALNTLILNKIKGNLRLCAIKPSVYGPNRQDILNDIAIASGATFISESTGTGLRQLSSSDLGSVKKVIVSKDDTTIITDSTSTELVSHCDNIRELIENQEEPHLKQALKDRLANLSNGVAIVSVGAATPFEMNEKRDRIDDAIRATKSAIEEGIVAGGGTALIRCLAEITNVPYDHADEKIGIDIIKKAIEYPLMQICINSGVDVSSIMKRVKKSKGKIGYNASTNKFEDLIKSGVIDPKKVVRVALENAASIAATLLTTECLIVETNNK